MACTSKTLSGLAADCSPSQGGIRKVWISSCSGIHPTIDSTSNKITALTFAESTNTVGNSFKVYNFKKNTGSMTSTLNVDAANGVNYVSTVLSLVFTKMETTKRIEVAALALDDMYIVVLDSNGKYWYLGADEACTCTAGTGQTGTAKGDANNYTIEITDESSSFPYELDSTLSADFDDID